MNFKRVAPIILTGISVIASIAAVVMSAHDTPKAIEILDDHRLELDPTGETELLMSEKLKDYAKGYWRTGILLGVSITSSIASCAIGKHNYTALLKSSAAIAALGGTYTSKYKEEVKKLIGEEKEKLIDQKARRAVKETNFTDAVWFWEPITETLFKSSLQTVSQERYDGTTHIYNGDVVSLGDMFPELKRSVEYSKSHMLDMVWDTDDMYDRFGWSVPLIDFVEINKPGSENDEDPQNHRPNFNNGRHTYIIQYSHDPYVPPFTD